MDIFSPELTFQPTRLLLVTAKVSTTDTYGLALFQDRERAVMDTVLIWLPYRKSIVKILIGRKYYVKHFEQKDFEIFLAGQAVLQMSQILSLCVIASMSY